MRVAPAKRPSKNRDKLLAAGRRLFAEKGFAETGTEEIVREAGVTRGALYHQFADKQDLFQAVLEKMLPEIGQRLFDETMSKIKADREDLKVGCQVLLGIYADPEVRRLFLIEGPAVLGFLNWKTLQAPLSKLFLDHALQHLVDEGILPSADKDPIGDLLAGALQQAGLGIAAAADVETARAHYGAAMDRLVDGLMAGQG
jgi:AcrR family transcriptional regulator|tara:strand:+ start:44571 stop:45170 length:600 start_codon:yes stop_codon:yes gene_type:complete